MDKGKESDRKATRESWVWKRYVV